eukprot:jgi/Bigna1/76321/fgenesh1_pg.40_\
MTEIHLHVPTLIEAQAKKSKRASKSKFIFLIICFSRRTGATPQSGFSHISNTDKRPVAASQTRENLISCAENKPVEQGSILEVKTSAGFSIELQSIDVKKINEASADSAATILQVGSTGARSLKNAKSNMRSIRGRRAAAARTKGLQQIIHRLNVLACFGSVIYIFAVVFVALVAFRTLNADETKKYSTVIEEEKENYRLQEDHIPVKFFELHFAGTSPE